MSILKQDDLFGYNEAISAGKLDSVKQKIEEKLNGQLHGTAGNLPGDTDLDELINFEKIRPGKFYGAPAPRSEFASSDVHYRQSFSRSRPKHYRSWMDISQDWEPIPGLSVTCHVAPQQPGLVSQANVMCNFAAHDLGGGTNSSNYTENKRHSVFALWVKRNDTPPVFIENTIREIMCSTNNDYLWARRNIAIQAVVTLSHGINHIYVAQRNVLGTSESSADRSDGARLTIQSRSIVVDIAYI